MRTLTFSLASIALFIALLAVFSSKAQAAVSPSAVPRPLTTQQAVVVYQQLKLAGKLPELIWLPD